MKQHLATNLRYLRGLKNWSQRKLAEESGITVSSVSAYENGRSEPKLTSLNKLAHVFGRSLDELYQYELEKRDQLLPEDLRGAQIRILPITLDEEGQSEKVSLVPVKAAAGYARGMEDVEFIAELPQFSLPFNELSQDRTYRVFQIEGDSMDPIPNKSYIICEYVQNWEQADKGWPHVVVTRDEGLLFKRIYEGSKKEQLKLVSDNPLFEPFEMGWGSIKEVWKARGYVAFDLERKSE